MQSNKSNGQLTAQINMGDHKKSGFDLSNNVLGTGKIGRIIPTRALHVMPGDTIKADSKVAVQFEPLAVPILANMDVKQEHFYVPYNVVWKNWDKFISGGEKLDYNGVVPNATVYRYYATAMEFLGLDNLLLSKVDNITDPETNVTLEGYTFVNRPQVLKNLKSSIDTIADSFYIKDILVPQYKAVEMLGNIDVSLYDDSLYFRRILTDGLTEDAKEATLKSYLEYYGMTGNKYIEEITPFLYRYMDAYGYLVLPTRLGFDFISMVYELIKPFIGLGSNLDYLNMCRLTLSEYIASLIVTLTMYYLDSIAFPTFVPNAACISRAPLSILNLRANYNIWYNNYRDILLEENAVEPYDGDNITDDEIFVLLVPRQRCWEKDAFTTALDNPGTGNVGVPLSQNSYLVDAPNNNIPNYYNVTKIQDIGRLSQGQETYDMNGDNSNICQISFDGQTWNIPTPYLTGVNEKVDLIHVNQNVQGFSLHALDAAQRAQKWLQKALYFGNRISDFYYMRFGVRFLDARLRLPELLTSSSELVKLDVIMNNTNITTEANGEVFRSIAGDRAAYASAYDNGNSFDRFCEEHGVIMSYLTIMPQITYAYGINRDYSRLDQFDFAFAEFATLGMDAVYDTEITATSFQDEEDGAHAHVFGYQGRYYDYKAKHSEEHGELLDSQDMYTFSRKFNMFDSEGRPKLNYEFVHCFPSLDMFVVDDEFSDYFRFDIRHSTAAERELPAQSIYI